MLKLRRLELEGFRGARFALQLDFGVGHRSISIFGENGVGKSTISDALEWMINNRVVHLWAEECKEDSLRHVLLSEADPCNVCVEFSDGITTTKTLFSDLSISHTNKSIEFQLVLAKLKEDRIFLRLTDLTKFILDTKIDKRNAIASIIGYDDIVEFRNTVKSVCAALERDGSYVAAKMRVDQSKRALFEEAGQLLLSKKSLYQYLNAEVAKNGFTSNITDKASFDSTVVELRNKTNQAERVEHKLRLNQLCKSLTLLTDSIPKVIEKAKFVPDYNKLVLEKSTLDQINLQDFLTSGLKIIDGGHSEQNKCPLCLTTYDLGQLRSQVDLRLQAIAHIASHLDEFSNSAQSFFTELKNLIALLETIKSQINQFPVTVSNSNSLAELKRTAEEVLTSQTDKFREHEGMSFPEGLFSNLATQRKEAEKRIAEVVHEVNELEFTAYETQVISLIERLQGLHRDFDAYDQNLQTVQAFQTQILALGEVFDQFIEVQNSALQNVLDKISRDVGRFYQTLHPNENIDSVSLKITGEEGVEFEYLFHGLPTHPPRKYLSESHLNSLGLVFFLASAKLFNTHSRFLILDDIVTSLDSSHRRRLLRLIREFFGGWQIVLLTHEPFWFEMIKKELGSDGWMFKDIVWDEENGAQLSTSSKDVRTLIESKRKNGMDVSNDLRKLTEATLKELASDLQVKMAFRYNDENERRMTGELLSELRSTINQRSPELKGHKVFAQLEASSLIATVGSHDNSETIVGADIDVALADLKELQTLFTCPRCHRSISAKNVVPGEGAISCKCGCHKLRWK